MVGKRHRRVFWLLLLALVLAWEGGLLGPVLRGLGLRLLLPYTSEELRVQALHEEIGADASGITVALSRSRLLEILREAVGWRLHLLPRHLFPESAELRAEVRVRLDKSGEVRWVPLRLRLQPEVERPQIRFRWTDAEWNAFLLYEDSFANRSEREAYLLGHYDLENEIRFATLHLRSLPPAGEPVTHRRLEGEATGRVRYWFRENLFDVRSTANVKRMSVVVDLDFHRYADGISLKYQARIPELNATFKNVAPWLERKLSERIRESLEASWNREKRRVKLERSRFPAWLPLDAELLLEVAPPQALVPVRAMP